VLPSVIIFRGWTGQTNEQADLILGNLESIIEDLRAGSIVVITPDRIRVRRLGLDSPDP
jgi:predicted nuclease of predicted toxin-antitoxin system